MVSQESVFITGSKAVAHGARLAKAKVVAAYPITPQTGMVNAIAEFIAEGEMDSEMIHVESEHSALSAVVAASLGGVRTFTATSSQGLALMFEVTFFASGMRTPLVMGVANRALSAPVTIFSDHQDSVSQRDNGWLQFYCENTQEALDTTLIAYRVSESEDVLLPSMVCLDGFFLTHMTANTTLPSQQMVQNFLPEFDPRYPIMDVENPIFLGTPAWPAHHEEFQLIKHAKLKDASREIDKANEEFFAISGRKYFRSEEYHCEDADAVIVGMGSMVGTIRETVDRMRSKGLAVGLLKVKNFRPFPKGKIIQLAKRTGAIGVLDRSVSYGSGGPLFTEITSALYNKGIDTPVLSFIGGLGGRDVTPQIIEAILQRTLDAAKSQSVEKEETWISANPETVQTWRLEDHV